MRMPCAGIPVGQASIGLLIFIAFFLVAAVFTGASRAASGVWEGAPAAGGCYGQCRAGYL